MVGELSLRGRRLPAAGAGLAGDAPGLPAAQPTDHAAGRRLRPQPPLRRGRWRRRKRLRSAESVESGLGDELEAGIGADEVRLANETGAMI